MEVKDCKEIGRRLRLVGSNKDILSTRVTSACFRELEKMPEEREKLKMGVKNYRTGPRVAVTRSKG